MFRTIWRIVRSTAGPVRPRGWWRAQVRPGVFIGVFVFIFGFVFAYRVNLYFKQGEYKNASASFVQCIMIHMLSVPNPLKFCGNHHGKPAAAPSLPLYFLFQMAVGGQGLLNSVIFGTQRANLDLWLALLRGQGVHGGPPKKQPLLEQSSENNSARSNRSSEYGSGDERLMRSNAIPYASSAAVAAGARNKHGELLSDAEDQDHLTYSGAGGGHPGFSGSLAAQGVAGTSWGRGSRPGSFYIAPSFERNDDVTSASSFTTLPAAIGSMMGPSNGGATGPVFMPMQNAVPRINANQSGSNSAGGKSPRDRSPTTRNSPRRNSATRGAQLGPVSVPSPAAASARVPAGVATASVIHQNQSGGGSSSQATSPTSPSNVGRPTSPQQHHQQ